jgi:hypothetical protein
MTSPGVDPPVRREVVERFAEAMTQAFLQILDEMPEVDDRQALGMLMALHTHLAAACAHDALNTEEYEPLVRSVLARYHAAPEMFQQTVYAMILDTSPPEGCA